jgi:hypothetical protein
MEQNHSSEGKSPSYSQEITDSLLGVQNSKERNTLRKYAYFKR